MDRNPVEGVLNCVDRLLFKLEAFSKQYGNSLDNMVTQLETLERELIIDTEEGAELSVTAVLIWEQSLKKLRDILSQMGQEHRGMHGGVSKCGKEIDRNFVCDFAGVSKSQQCYELRPELRERVCRLIAEHLLSQGRLDAAETLAQEADINVRDDNRAIFEEMNGIVESLKGKDVDGALRWAQTHSDQLAQRNSKLEFSLHRLKFLNLLRQKKGVEALQYAKKFQQFAKKHSIEIQKLMGSLAYLSSGLDNSPYANLLDDVHWVEIEEMFTRDACALYGLPTQSALSVVVNAGAVALPALIGLRRVMQQRQVANVWTHHSDELPIEIDLGAERHYHSVFSCPILRQQTTDANPPMRLSCGHVISRDALLKLAQNNRHFRLKCPYCPIESTVGDAKRVYF